MLALAPFQFPLYRQTDELGAPLAVLKVGVNALKGALGEARRGLLVVDLFSAHAKIYEISSNLTSTFECDIIYLLDGRSDMDYAAHIVRICKIESIEVQSHSSGGRAYRRKRLIMIKPVKTAVTYAVALHEIGHILGPRQTGKNTRLDKEVGAWEWAQSNAIEWTEVMTAKRAKCLQSYLAKAARSPHMKQPAPDHPIHAMAA